MDKITKGSKKNVRTFKKNVKTSQNEHPQWSNMMPKRIMGHHSNRPHSNGFLYIGQHPGFNFGVVQNENPVVVRKENQWNPC